MCLVGAPLRLSISASAGSRRRKPQPESHRRCSVRWGHHAKRVGSRKSRNQHQSGRVEGPPTPDHSRLDGDRFEHSLDQEALEFDPLRVPQLGEGLVCGRNADKGRVGEAVGEGKLSAMQLGIELLTPPAVAGLVQVSPDVEIDQALPPRLDASHLFADRDQVAVILIGLKRHKHVSRGRIGQHPEHHLLDMSLDRLGLDSDSTAPPVAGKLPTGVAGDAVLPNE